MRETTEEECVDSSMAAKVMTCAVLGVCIVVFTLLYPLCWVAEKLQLMARDWRKAK